MKGSQWLKRAIARTAEEAFAARYGRSRDEWVREQMMAGVDPKVAETESRRLAKEAVDEKSAELLAIGKRNAKLFS